MAAAGADITTLFPEDVLIEIGKIIASWSQVESVFDSVYMRKVIRDHSFDLGDPRLDQLGQSFARRLREVRDVVTTSGTDAQRTKWDRVLSQCDRLRKKRDIVAHGVFNVVPKEGGEVMEIRQDTIHLSYKSYKNRKPHDFGLISLKSLQTTRAQISQLWLDLMDAHLTD